MSGYSHPLEDLIVCAFAVWLGGRRGIAFGTPTKLDTPRPGEGQTKMPDYLIPSSDGENVLVEMKRVGPSQERYAGLGRFVRDVLKTIPDLMPAHYDLLFLRGDKGIPRKLPTLRKADCDREEVRQFRRDITQAAISASVAGDGTFRLVGPPEFAVHRSQADSLSSAVYLFSSTDEGDFSDRCEKAICECEQKFEAATKEQKATTTVALFLSKGGFSTDEVWYTLHRLKANGKMNHTAHVYSVYLDDKGLSIQQFWPHSHGDAGTLYPVEHHYFSKEWRGLLRSYFGG